MGTTTLITRIRRLAALIGISEDQDIPAHVKTELKDHVQRALRDIYSWQPWEFLSFYSRVELEAAYNDGSVAVTAGATAWTGAGTSWDTGWTDNVKIRIGSEIYRIASVDSATALTGTDASLTTETAASYVLYIDEYSLDSTLEYIESIMVGRSGPRMRFISPSEMSDLKSRGFLSGIPNFYTVRGVDSSGYTVIEVYPVPGANEILHVRGYKAGTIPTADGGTDSIPQRFSNVVDERAKTYLYEYKKDERLPIADARFQRAILKMIEMETPAQGPQGLRLDPSLYGPPRIDSDMTIARLM